MAEEEIMGEPTETEIDEMIAEAWREVLAYPRWANVFDYVIELDGDDAVIKPFETWRSQLPA
jgi:hypothetical protein